MIEDVDILLIGAGPLGVEMAVGLKRAGLSYVQVESGQVGATIQWWAPGTRWFSSNERISIAGVPLVTPLQEKASREEYLAYLRSIVMQYGLRVETYTRVVGIEREGDRFLVRARRNVRGTLMGAERVWRARRIILSTGGTERPNLLGIPGEELPHVSHYFQDPHAYFEQDLLIVGGRNSAVEAALRCYRAGARIQFNYRRDAVDAKDIKYWLYPEYSSLIKLGRAGGGIDGHFQSAPVEITPDSVLLRNVITGGTERVHADFVLLMTGYVADMSLANMVGVELTGDQNLPVYNPTTMETNVPGVFVIGTAIAGTQRRYKVFLENCHVHVERVLGRLLGKHAAAAEVQEKIYERPES